MYQHHRESLEIMQKYFEMDPEVIALIFGGSVAKECARPDSDLDAMVVVSDEVYERLEAENNTTRTVSGKCTYERGYWDLKYMTKSYLSEAAEKGSEPTRNSFMKSRVLFSRDPEIPGIVERIPVFQKREKEEKMLSFYADFCLNYYYFLKGCQVDGYMRLHAISEIIYCLYRIILQENEVFFPCNRRLEETVAGISERTKQFTVIGRKLAESQTMEDADAFVLCFREISGYQPPEEYSRVLTQYTRDFEQWWRVPRPNINEW